MSSIFLSHSSKDNFEAIALRDWLASEGWKDVFLDLDPERGIAAGERWERALHEAANRCEAVIFLVSANWLASGWCLKGICARARAQQEAVRGADRSDDNRSPTLPRRAVRASGRSSISFTARTRDCLQTKPPGSHEERHVGYSQSGLLRLKRGLEKAGLDAEIFRLAAGERTAIARPIAA